MPLRVRQGQQESTFSLGFLLSGSYPLRNGGSLLSTLPPFRFACRRKISGIRHFRQSELELRAEAGPESDLSVAVVGPERFQEGIAGDGAFLPDGEEDFIKDEVVIAVGVVVRQLLECRQNGACWNGRLREWRFR